MAANYPLDPEQIAMLVQDTATLRASAVLTSIVAEVEGNLQKLARYRSEDYELPREFAYDADAARCPQGRICLSALVWQAPPPPWLIEMASENNISDIVGWRTV